MCMADSIIYPGTKVETDSNKDVIIPSVEEQQGSLKSCCHKTLVVFIGGAADATYQPLLRGVFAPYQKSNRTRQDIAYSEHGGGNLPKLIEDWFAAGQKIILVGHSWGGDRAIKLAYAMPHITFTLVVTLDPVSRSSNKTAAKPNNIKEWQNIYIKYDKADNSVAANLVAKAGSPWEACVGADFNFAVNVEKPSKTSPEKQKFLHHGSAPEMFNEVTDYVQKQ